MPGSRINLGGGDDPVEPRDTGKGPGLGGKFGKGWAKQKMKEAYNRLAKYRNRGGKPRLKRSVTDPKYLELALIVDEAMYEQYVSLYGSEDALAELQDWVDGLMDAVQILFQLSSLTPVLNFKVHIFLLTIRTQG